MPLRSRLAVLVAALVAAPVVARAQPAPDGVLRLSAADVVRLAARAPAAVRTELDLELASATVRAAADRPWGVALDVGTAPVVADATLGATTPPGYIDASLGHRLVTGTALTFAAHDGVASATAGEGRSLRAAVTQPLVRGAGATATLASERAARHDARALGFTAQATRAAIVADATAAYWELVFAHADLAIRLASVEAARAQHRLTTALVRGGQVPRAALLATQQAVDARVGAVMVAEHLQLERAVALRTLLGLPLDAAHILVVPIDSVDPTAADATAAPLDLAALLAGAARHSPEVAATRAALDAARARRDGADDRARPALDLTAAATWLPGDGAADARLTGPATDELRLTATLTVRHDLGGPAAGVRAQARARERLAELELSDTRRRLRAAVILAATGVDTARQRSALARQVADRARMIVDAETARFTAGGATVFDVLRRQEELESAQRQRVRAGVELAIAQAELSRLTAASTAPAKEAR